MSKFNVGDKLTVRKDFAVPGILVAGDTVTVDAVAQDGFLDITTSTGIKDYGRDPTRFEMLVPFKKPAKVRTLKGYCKAIYDVLAATPGQPVSGLALNRACGATTRGYTATSDATGARIRDLRKPIYGGHNIVYDRKADTYTLLAA